MTDLVIDTQTWLISDSHFGHANICHYCQRPPNHNELMLKRWQDHVEDGATVLHLGDLMWHNGGHWHPMLKRLAGEKWLIKGNHDQVTAAALEQKTGFRYVETTVLPEYAREPRWKVGYLLATVNDRRLAFSHAPLPLKLLRSLNAELNLHGHVHRESCDRPDYINCCVEVLDYCPQRLGDLTHGR